MRPPQKNADDSGSFMGFIKNGSKDFSNGFKPVLTDKTFSGYMKSVASSSHTMKLAVSLLIILHLQSAVAVKIRRMNVPRWVENGTVDSVILDCDYLYTDKDALLVVKWFLDNDPEPVYQWITEYDTRYASKRFQEHINMNFMVTPSNHMTRYRALNIIKPTTIFNGKYTCHVVSLTSQDTAEQVMTVYAPPKRIDFNFTRTTNTGSNLSCEAKDIFPLPHIMLNRWTIQDPEPQLIFDLRSQYDSTNNGAFDTLVSHEIVDKHLPPGENTRYECTVSIPGTNYKVKKSLIYYPGLAVGSASNHTSFTLCWIAMVAFGLYFS